MASDEIVWNVIGHQFCAYKLQIDSKSQTFCRNEYNLTGFCSRQSCPLANSRYATVRPDPDTNQLCLYIKTVERAHLPSKWWEKVKLPANYTQALEVIDTKLIYWPKFYTHKCKQRLTRLTQVGIRTRRIAREEERLGEKLVPRLASKVKRREATRERKAEGAAKVERAIERELVERLRSGAYGDRPLNVEEGVWKKVLRGLERAERGEELVDGEEEEIAEGEEEKEVEVEYVSDLEESEGEYEQEMEDFDDWLGGESAEEENDDDSGEDSDEGSDDGSGDGDREEAEDDEEDADAGAKRKRRSKPVEKPKPRKRPARVEIEYEFENELPQRVLA